MQALVILALAALAGACATAAEPQPAPGAPQVGTYFGRLPCADCAGVDTRLTLFGPPDFRYRLEQTYVDGATSTSEGEYVILRGDAVDPDATVFQIGVEGETPFYQRITDDEVRLLDREQRPIVSAANLSLRRLR